MAERFFAEFFSVSFSVTHAGVILRLLLSILYSLHLITAMLLLNYGLEYFDCLGIACIYHSAHTLFEYKLVFVILILRV